MRQWGETLRTISYTSVTVARYVLKTSQITLEIDTLQSVTEACSGGSIRRVRILTVLSYTRSTRLKNNCLDPHWICDESDTSVFCNMRSACSSRYHHEKEVGRQWPVAANSP